MHFTARRMSDIMVWHTSCTVGLVAQAVHMAWCQLTPEGLPTRQSVAQFTVAVHGAGVAYYPQVVVM